MTAVQRPHLEYAFEVRVDVAESERIGHGDGDVLSFTPITGGTVDGPLLRGSVVPGGGDWSVERRKGTIELDARYLLRADDGALIDIVNRGFFRVPPELAEAAEAGERIPEEQVYFRTSPVFRTDAPAHRWLAESVFVGLAHDDHESGQIVIRFFVVR
jgi:hypothetical protein